MIEALPPDAETVRRAVALYRAGNPWLGRIQWAAGATIWGGMVMPEMDAALSEWVYQRTLERIMAKSCEPPPAPRPTCKNCGEPIDSHVCATCGGCWVKCGCPR